MYPKIHILCVMGYWYWDDGHWAKFLKVVKESKCEKTKLPKGR